MREEVTYVTPPPIGYCLGHMICDNAEKRPWLKFTVSFDINKKCRLECISNHHSRRTREHLSEPITDVLCDALHFTSPTFSLKGKKGHRIHVEFFGCFVNIWTMNGSYSISQEICTRFLLCCALLWLYIDWFSHIHQAYFTGTVAI